jgi:hypothetical protein
MNLDQFLRAFKEHHYSLFDVNQADLGSLYQGELMLTFKDLKIPEARNLL